MRNKRKNLIYSFVFKLKIPSLRTFHLSKKKIKFRSEKKIKPPTMSERLVLGGQELASRVCCFQEGRRGPSTMLTRTSETYFSFRYILANDGQNGVEPMIWSVKNHFKNP